MEDYNTAIELNLKYAIAYNNRGEVFVLQKEYSKAVQDLSKVIKLDPNLYIAYANKGIAYLRLGNKEQGCIDLTQAMSLVFKEVEQLYNQNCQ